MNWIPTVLRCLGISALVLAQATFSNVSPLCAETYIAGQFGVTFPSPMKGLSDGDLTSTSVTDATGTLNFPSGTTVSDQALKTSYMFGGKIGHYFNRARWFGIEAEIFYGNPHVKQQDITLHSDSPFTFTPSGGGPSSSVGNDLTRTNVPGVDFHVLTIAPLNLMFRYPGTRLQPYLGVGPGIFFARFNDRSVSQGENSQSSTNLGLNALIGARYYFTRHLSMFAEGKFNYVRFSFKENPNFFGFDATYAPLHASFGLSVHF